MSLSDLIQFSILQVYRTSPNESKNLIFKNILSVLFLKFFAMIGKHVGNMKKQNQKISGKRETLVLKLQLCILLFDLPFQICFKKLISEKYFKYF